MAKLRLTRKARLNIKCFGLFKKDYDTLVKEAKSGNNKSLYELLVIDKNIVNEDWVRNRYNEAVEMLESESIAEGDKGETFIRKYGEALSKMPKTNKTTVLREFLYIHIRPSSGRGIDEIKPSEFNKYLDWIVEEGIIDKEMADKIGDYNAIKTYLHRLKKEIQKNS